MKKLPLPIITKFIIHTSKEEALLNDFPQEIKDVPESFSNPHKEIIRL